MRLRSTDLALFAGGLLSALYGCGPRSIVIGGDPENTSGASGYAGTAGSMAGLGGSAPGNGGTLPLGGSSAVNGGTTAAGGSAIGGTTAAGGSVIGGTSAATGGGTADGGEGSVFDAYPRVIWEGGQGYRRSCPRFDDVWGVTCWNFQVNESDPDQSTTGSCKLDGNPDCNACSCAVPCETGDDCPLGLTGHPADCVASALTARSCFLVCDDESCPTGMTCMSYPGSGRRVCMWLSGDGTPPT